VLRSGETHSLSAVSLQRSVIVLQASINVTFLLLSHADDYLENETIKGCVVVVVIVELNIPFDIL